MEYEPLRRYTLFTPGATGRIYIQAGFDCIDRLDTGFAGFW